MKLFVKVILIFILGMAFSVAASDINQFDYYGLGIQNNDYDKLDFSPGFDASKITPNKYKESDSLGLRLFAGHQFNQYIGVEAGIGFYSKSKFSITQKDTDANGKVTNKKIHQGSFSTTSGDIRVIGTYPINNNMFFKAQVGALVWSNKFNFLTGDLATQVLKTDKDTGVSLLTGVGVGYGFNKKFAISLDVEKTKIHKIDTQTLALSVSLRF